MRVGINDKSRQFCIALPRTSHKAQVGGGCGFVEDFGSFTPVFMAGGGGEVDAKAISSIPKGGCDTISIGWIGVNTICGFRVGKSGSRNHTGIPKVNPGRLSVYMSGLLTIQEG